MPKFHATLIDDDRAEVRIAGTPFILNAVRRPDGTWRGLSIEHDGDVIELVDAYDPDNPEQRIGISHGALAAIERAERERV